ncbi:MAG: hypothetical protein ABIN25_10710 [Ginsengibacter sp.]
MSSFPIPDLVAGIIFIYFLLSIITSSAIELCFSILINDIVRLKNDIKNLQALDLPLGCSGTEIRDAMSFWNYFKWNTWPFG